MIRRILTVILILLTLLAAAIAIKKYAIPYFDKSDEETSENEETGKNTIIQDLFIEHEEPFEPISITVSSMGDCTIGRDAFNDYSLSLNGYYDKHGADYFFKNVRDILEADDLSIINFEGTLTESEARMDKQFAFKAPPEYVKILTGSSVEAANIANNHSKDYGIQSQQDTIKFLDEAGIVNFGYERIQVMEIKGIKVGLTGIYELPVGLGAQSQVKENPVQTDRNNEGRFLAPEPGKSRGGVSFRV
jgi:poly-gamma-glutamate synthesis protein (capsule biosynthesis protein)